MPPQDRTNFNEQQGRGPRIPSGDLLSRMGMALNAGARSDSPGGHQQSFHGPFRAGYPQAPLAFGLATITDASDECPTDSASPTGEADAPCASKGKYLARFRYFNHNDGEWATTEQDLRLDATGYDTSPSYSAGDVTAAWWDEQRGWLIPVHVPPAQMPTEEWESQPLTPAIDLEGGAGTPPPFDGVIAQVQWNHGTGWRGLYGRDLTIAIPRHATGLYRVNSLFTAFPVQNGTKIRLVAGVGANEDFGAHAISWGVRLWFVTRGVSQTHTDLLSPTDDVFVAYGGMKTLGPLQRHGVSQGGTSDNPALVQVAPGVLQVASEGFWTVYVDFRLEVRNKLADKSSSSSSSSSSKSESSSKSTSSQSGSSSGSSPSSASSASSVGDGVCVQVVVDVECVSGNLEVTKCFICGPDLSEECESDASSPSSSGGSSQSSLSSLSSSASSASSESSSAGSSASSLSSVSSSDSSAVVGACCGGFEGGACLETDETDCINKFGEWLGPGTTCDPNPCDESTQSSFHSSSSSNSSSYSSQT